MPSEPCSEENKHAGNAAQTGQGDASNSSVQAKDKIKVVVCGFFSSWLKRAKREHQDASRDGKDPAAQAF